jgi:tetratricopeptide (TPR) repeat protein
MLGHLDRAEAAAEALDDDALRALVTGQRAHMYWFIGQHRRALELAEGELVLARRVSNPSLEASANFHLGEARYALGQFEAAAECLGGALDLLVEALQRKGDRPSLAGAGARRAGALRRGGTSGARGD